MTKSTNNLLVWPNLGGAQRLEIYTKHAYRKSAVREGRREREREVKIIAQFTSENIVNSKSIIDRTTAIACNSNIQYIYYS